MAAIRATAFAKINLALQIRGVRRDGYHELGTTYQTLALHDTLTFTACRGPFEIRCSDPTCPVDATNLVWSAAEQVWRAAGRRGVPAGVVVRLVKRIPLQAGLGGGSSDAAAALRALAKLWRVRLSRTRLARIAAGLGADVPFFLHGGTALGAGRGDRLRPLDDRPAAWVVLLLPDFGVSTKEAYGWWDQSASARPFRIKNRTSPHRLLNDLEGPVSERYPAIARIVAELTDAGASNAGMSGSGSAVFGFFPSSRAAASVARTLRSPTLRTIVTRTLSRKKYQMLARPQLAGETAHRINLTFAPRGFGRS